MTKTIAMPGRFYSLPFRTREHLSNARSNSESRGAKIRVENVHYELTEEDLSVCPNTSLHLRDCHMLTCNKQGLFEKIGPIAKLELVYDRAGRSEGVAYVTYQTYEDAKQAVREYDGANAAGELTCPEQCGRWSECADMEPARPTHPTDHRAAGQRRSSQSL